jgi:sugar/nucleoside kinase (ribokinase family)
MYERNGAELHELFRRVKATGVTTSLDMSVPDPSSPSGRADWRAILAKTLPDVDIFLPSGEEILFMLHREQFQQFMAAGDLLEQVTPQLLSDLGAELLDMGAAIVVIKLGRRGFYLRTGDPARMANMGRARPIHPESWAGREIWGPAFQVEEVGATGAGDASIAGFHAALLRALSPEEAVIMATAVGACNVEAADGLSGILPWEATRRRIDGNWPKHALDIDVPGWRFDPESRLWSR